MVRRAGGLVRRGELMINLTGAGLVNPARWSGAHGRRTPYSGPPASRLEWTSPGITRPLAGVPVTALPEDHPHDQPNAGLDRHPEQHARRVVPPAPAVHDLAGVV